LTLKAPESLEISGTPNSVTNRCIPKDIPFHPSDIIVFEKFEALLLTLN